MQEGATVVDWEGNVHQEGTNGYTCLPSPPMLQGLAPMCMDAEWMKWADAWMNKKDFAASTIGISYMLEGDEGASNIDPYAEGPTEDNEWIEEGAHLPLDAALKLEWERYQPTLDTEDRVEALEAFAEKRPPQFRGR